MSRARALLILALMTIAACAPAPQESRPTTAVIAIGSDFPLTGVFGASGFSTTEGARYAVEQRRTIGKFRLIFKPFDDSLAGVQDPAKGAQNIKRMGVDSEILGIVGPFNSTEAKAEIPVASQYNLALVSPSATANCLTASLVSCQVPARPGAANTFFRIAAPDTAQARAMADFAVQRLHSTSIAVLSDGHSYGEGLAASFIQALPGAGGTVVLREQLQSSSNDFSELLQRIKARGGQAIYVGGSPSFGVCRIRAQMQAILPAAYFLGGDALLDQSCVKDASSGANDRMIATIAQGPPSADPRTRKVVDDYKKSGHPVGAYTFAAYDCAEILIDAIQRAIDRNAGRLPSRQQVLEAVAVTHLQGVTGNWSFDAHGDATAPGISFYRVEGGSWSFWQAVTVAGKSN